MKLIHLQGLNCYHDCMITLANAFGINYTLAFSRLWSEGELHYAPISSVFLSRRLEEALENMGMKLSTPQTTKNEREISWADTWAGNYVIVGMDAYLIPWCPIHQLLHGPHYFIVKKGRAELHDCFDPTYGITGKRLAAQDLVSNAYHLISVEMDTSALLPIDNISSPLLAQSQEVLTTHPETLLYFLEHAGIWMKGTEKTVLLPAKYIDGLLTGRYLYKHFLEEQGNAKEKAAMFFSRQYYDQWLTVKNGFYKAALTRQDSAAFNEAFHLLTDLFEQEMELARQICS